METTTNKITSITVNPYPVLTQQSIAELFLNGRVIVDSEEREVFAEVESGGFHILCEKLELDTEFQDITIFYNDIQITDESTITEIANWLCNYAIDEIANDSSAFTYDDQQHAISQIYS